MCVGSTNFKFYINIFNAVIITETCDCIIIMLLIKLKLSSIVNQANCKFKVNRNNSRTYLFNLHYNGYEFKVHCSN